MTWWLWIFVIYTLVGMSVFFMAPYRHDVPFSNRLLVSVLWFPVLLWCFYMYVTD